MFIHFILVPVIFESEQCTLLANTSSYSSDRRKTVALIVDEGGVWLIPRLVIGKSKVPGEKKINPRSLKIAGQHWRITSRLKELACDVRPEESASQNAALKS